jgi:serine/threonine-protein kinase HipA
MDDVRKRHAPTADLHQLWRRLVFNLLITTVDDHLQNHGFLHVEHGLWRLAPAFDLNPFPDKERESKTWLSEAARWREVALGAAVGPRMDELDGFAAAFEHEQMAATAALLGR